MENSLEQNQDSFQSTTGLESVREKMIGDLKSISLTEYENAQKLTDIKEIVSNKANKFDDMELKEKVELLGQICTPLNEDDFISSRIFKVQNDLAVLEQGMENLDAEIDGYHAEMGVDMKAFHKEQSALIGNAVKIIDGERGEDISTPETDKYKAWEKANPEKSARLKELNEKWLDIEVDYDPRAVLKKEIYDTVDDIVSYLEKK